MHPSKLSKWNQGQEFFNNRKEDWAVFCMKFKALPAERAYDKILDRLERVSAEDAKMVDDDNGRKQERFRKMNKRGCRDVVLAFKEMSLTIVGNLNKEKFPSDDL